MKGIGVTPGYLRQKDDEGAFTDDGWFVTGDLGSVSLDGRIFITGRSKDLIIRSGHNIDPKIIEEVALLHTSIAEAAAVGQPDSYAGEIPVCFVVPKQHEIVDEEELLEFMRAYVAERPSVPKHIYVLPAMPVTSVGKIFKPALRCLAAQNAVSGMLSDLAEVIVEATDVHGKGMMLTVRHSSELSVDILELIALRLKTYPIRWELIEINESPTVAEMV